MTVTPIAAALDAAAAAGPFFVLDTDSPVTPDDPAAPPWRPFTALIEDPAVLAARVEAVAQAVAERARIEVDRIDRRAAASLTHLGLAARLVCPPLGTALLGGVVLDLDATTLWWRDVLGAVPLALPEPRGRPVDADVVAALAAGLADGPVAALTEVMAANGVSRKVLWGNVASAVAGARSALVAAAPDRASSILATVQALFDVEPLVGTGAFGGGMQPREFRRNSCCLYYRVPGGGYCGDCVLPGR